MLGSDKRTFIMFEIGHMSGVVRIPPSRLKHSLKDTPIGILKPPHWKLVRKIWKSLQFLYLFRHLYSSVYNLKYITLEYFITIET